MSTHGTLPIIPGTEPDRCVFDSFRTAIAKRLSDTLGLPIEKAYEGVDYGKKGVDFTVALPRFRLPGKVDELAGKVLADFQPDDWVESITHDKAFLHFQLNTPNMIHKILTQVNDLSLNFPNGDGEYGKSDSGKGKKVIVEYSSPNIAKSFHVGHLRSTIIGAFLANLYRAYGWEVISMNYLGDWGTQFGLIATGFEKYGSQELLEKDPIQHLFQVYVKVNKDAESDPKVKEDAAKFFQRMEQGDEAALANWRIWRELSVKKYTQEYEKLNVHFDRYTGESEVSAESQTQALTRLEELGHVTDSEGAKVVNLEKWKLGTAILRKRDGTSIYLTRDIGGAIERYEKYKFDKMIYVVSSQQDLHLQQLFRIMHLLGYDWASRLEHVNYGLVQGMSTRTGNVVFLEQIMDEAKSKMEEQMQKNEEKFKAVENPEQTSLEIALTGIKIQDMAAKRINNYQYAPLRMLSIEGDTGPYLQYAHVRLASIARNNLELLPFPSPPPQHIVTHPHLTSSSHARELAFLLGAYPDVVKTAIKTHEPSGIVTYIFRLSHTFSGTYDQLPVKSEADREKAQARLWLFECTRVVLAAAMKLLSLRPLECM